MNCEFLIKLSLLWLVTYGVTEDGRVATILLLAVYLRKSFSVAFKKRSQLDELSIEDKEQIEQLMKAPSSLEVTAYEEKIRRNLIVSAAAAIVFSFLDLQISPDSRFLGGIQFNNITSELVYKVLLIVIIYESVHYLWLVKNHFMYWRVRLTGTKHVEVRGNTGAMFGDQHAPTDHYGKDENSNFYVWMLEQQNAFLNQITNNEKQWAQIEDWVKSLKNESLKGVSESVISDRFNNLTNAINEQQRTINNIRISASMNRFDNWYDSLVKSQSWRWLVLDVALPALLSTLAITTLSYELYTASSTQENLVESPELYHVKELTTYTCTIDLYK
ncbi:hypothetical protein [Aliivibrio kagoshimensis]|uniref:hypothetical protein n=1 Tax=Aliivibrio kagoshimensis TaxID=2910230 RepID=UPI003D132200